MNDYKTCVVWTKILLPPRRRVLGFRCSCICHEMTATRKVSGCLYKSNRSMVDQKQVLAPAGPAPRGGGKGGLHGREEGGVEHAWWAAIISCCTGLGVRRVQYSSLPAQCKLLFHLATRGSRVIFVVVIPSTCKLIDRLSGQGYLLRQGCTAVSRVACGVLNHFHDHVLHTCSFLSIRRVARR